MTYNADKTWDQVSSEAATAATNMREAIIHAKEAYEEWISFKAGRSSSAIATALSATSGKTITSAMVDDAASCFQVFLELFNFATNVPSPTQGDRMFAMRLFT